MWKDLSFKERAELIKQWTKEHSLDYEAKKREYDATHANKYEDGGNTNPMNYEHRGTIYSDELKNQGITHVAEFPEVVVRGQRQRPYVSSYDPLALYRYGIEPALQGMGWAFDKALIPVDMAINAATMPAWGINKAITGNDYNTAIKVNEWLKQAIRDAGMLLSPTRDIGTIASGFEYAPWNPENPGIAGNDEVGQAMNNTFDLLLAPGFAKGTGKAVSYGLEEYALPRARAAAYNNVTPFSYSNNNLGSYKINKRAEIKDMAKDFFTPGKIDTTYPKWKKRYDEHIAKHPEDASKYLEYDYDNISAPAMMEFRDQAWAKAMRQPDNDRWAAKIYKDNGDGTVSYDLDAVDKIRTKYGSGEFSGEVSEGLNGIGFDDNITTNGGGVNITKNPDGTYRMRDLWDIQPMKATMDDMLKGLAVPELLKKPLRKLGNTEVVSTLHGDPFMLDIVWDPRDPRFGLSK